jgi:cellulose synthase/poly-beta-1,6-N-acetylglucosamine synthase-like glycosyltransferase
MIPSVTVILWIMGAILLVSVIMIIAVFLNKQAMVSKEIEERSAREYLVARYYRNEEVRKEYPPDALANAYRAILDQVVPPRQAAERIYRDFADSGAIDRWIRRLGSPFPDQRKAAAARLALFPAAPTKFALVNRLRIERKAHVRLYLIDALKEQMDQLTLEIIIRSVVGSKRFYQIRAAQVITNYILASRCRIPDVFTSRNPELKELFAVVAMQIRRPDFEEALQKELREIEECLAGGTAEVYAAMTRPRLLRMQVLVLRALASYGIDLAEERYLCSDNPEIVRIAVDSIADHADAAHLERLVSLSGSDVPVELLTGAVRRIIDRDPMLLQDVSGLLASHNDPRAEKVLAGILAAKIDYFVLRLRETAPAELTRIVRVLADNGLDAALIRFLNLNRDSGIEALLLPDVAAECERNPIFLARIREYLDPRLLKALGLKKAKAPVPEKESSKPDPSKRRFLWMILIAAVVLYPLLFLLSLLLAPGDGETSLAIRYLVFVNNASVVYFLTVNVIYLLLAVISIAGAARQRRLWSIKSARMMFEKGMLSSISIIAPAYNEELSIIESVHALLNLRYPDFEVIVVNDGSKDGTLEKLIGHFRLERRNPTAEEILHTRPVRAVYANGSIPNLLVIDKANGGKADALNVGINFATKEYVCGIDADSLLEPEALLKVMSTTLDHDEITLALGGNIIPVNGCIVDRGKIERTGLPRTWLPLAQTIEYLRAFTLGRIGWAQLDALLIVSGAFGVFERRILTEVGGYLTVATFHKDTVGEDMELVVRITRNARERALPFRVDYVHNANCYTEVPEKLTNLRKQRNRWQRGLIDILAYHRRMIFNPRYGTAGTLALPYFLLFETIGPLLEVQTYLAIVLSFVVGCLSVEIALLMFTVSVVLGLFVSMASLLVAEKHTVFMPAKETWRLIGMAIAENFGRRQYWSLHRLAGYFKSFHDDFSWGAMSRVGFKK